MMVLIHNYTKIELFQTFFNVLLLIYDLIIKLLLSALIKSHQYFQSINLIILNNIG